MVNQKGAAPILILVALIGIVAFLAISSSAPFQGTILKTLFPKIQSQAATAVSNCWPTSGAGFAGTLAGQPNAIWCYTDYSDGPSTAVKGNNSWVDEFNHGLSFGKFDTVNYTDFPGTGSFCKTQIFRHANHWMRDVDGIGPTGVLGDCAWDFGATAMRPNATFHTENGQLTIEGDVATRVESYGANQFWPEFVITTADHLGAPFKPGAPQYQPEIRTNGTYVYDAFPGSWTLGCRLQNDGGFTCALFDDGFGGDGPDRVFELSFFQCGNGEGGVHPGSLYGCNSIYGGHPSSVSPDVAAHTRDCTNLDPDVNCRDRWRWEITNNRLTWYANGVKYMEHSDFTPQAQAALNTLLSQPVYVYYGEFLYRLGKPARMHWDRIAINPKDANGNLLPPSASPTFCLGQPNNTCGANPAPSSTPGATPAPSTATPTPAPSSIPTGAITVDFNDAALSNNFSGEYPQGVINWITGSWAVVDPWKGLTTRNLGLESAAVSAGSFSLLQPRVINSIEAFNGGIVDSTVTLSCPGNTTKSQVVTVNTLSTINTGWTTPCSGNITITSSNSWDTNFDNLSLGAAVSSTPQPSGSPKPGDIDGNGKVDIFDYNTLLTNFGKTGTGIVGDLDGNGKVDIFDYNILLTNFGK